MLLRAILTAGQQQPAGHKHRAAAAEPAPPGRGTAQGPSEHPQDPTTAVLSLMDLLQHRWGGTFGPPEHPGLPKISKVILYPPELCNSPWLSPHFSSGNGKGLNPLCWPCCRDGSGDGHLVAQGLQLDLSLTNTQAKHLWHCGQTSSCIKKRPWGLLCWCFQQLVRIAPGCFLSLSYSQKEQIKKVNVFCLQN